MTWAQRLSGIESGSDVGGRAGAGNSPRVPLHLPQEPGSNHQQQRLETRKVLLGHRNGDITTHYSAPELEELLAAVNKVCEEKSGRPFPVSSHVPNNPLIELAFSTRTVLGYD